MVELTRANYKDLLKDGDSVLFYEGNDGSSGQVSEAVASSTYSGGFVVYGKHKYGVRGFSIELLLNKFTVKLLQH